MIDKAAGPACTEDEHQRRDVGDDPQRLPGDQVLASWRLELHGAILPRVASQDTAVIVMLESRHALGEESADE